MGTGLVPPSSSVSVVLSSVPDEEDICLSASKQPILFLDIMSNTSRHLRLISCIGFFLIISGSMACSLLPLIHRSISSSMRSRSRLYAPMGRRCSLKSSMLSSEEYPTSRFPPWLDDCANCFCCEEDFVLLLLLCFDER